MSMNNLEKNTNTFRSNFYRTVCIVLTAALMCATLTACKQEVQEDVTITLAAAASLKNAFVNDLIPAFNAKYPNIIIQATFDSSGKLQTQIEEGLQADVFFSAAMKQMNNLDNGGYIESSTINKLLENKIVLITSKQDTLGMTEFTDILKADTIAVGDPESVPAGQYAKEALTTLGIWDQVAAKASLGTNVTEVLSWVAAGSAQTGVVYATDAASEPGVQVIAEAPEGALVSPVIYPVAMVKTSAHQDEAKKFLSFLESEEATNIFEKYGFSVN